MYLPPAFADASPDVLHELIDQASIGSIVTLVDGELFATTAPLLLDRASTPYGRLIGHLARANPRAKRSADNPQALVIFGGPNGYVSPSMYPSKHEHGKVVPTWNYVAVHAWGPLVIHDDPASTLDLVSRLTDHHETRVRSEMAPIWTVTDAPAEFVASQLKAIVGIEVPITKLMGKRKLSQNRPEIDRAGVVRGFQTRAESGDTGAAAVAEAMIATTVTGR